MISGRRFAGAGAGIDEKNGGRGVRERELIVFTISRWERGGAYQWKNEGEGGGRDERDGGGRGRWRQRWETEMDVREEWRERRKK